MPRSSSLRWGRLLLLLVVCLCFFLPATVTAQKSNNNEASTATTTSSSRTKNLLLEEPLMNEPTTTNDYSDAEFDDAYDEQEDWLFGRRFLQDSTSESNRVNVWQKLKESLGLTIVGAILICCMPIFIWKNEGRHVRELVRIDFAKNKAVKVECNSAGDETLGQLVHFTGPISVGDAFLDFGSGGENKGQLDLIEPLPNCFILKRTCYIYQKFEDAQNSVDKDRIGGGETRTTTYTMREAWTTNPQPEGQLPHLPDHTNNSGIWDSLVGAAVSSQDDGSPNPGIPQGLPPEMAEKLGLVDTSKKPHGTIVAPSAAVGFFGLSRKIVLSNMPQFGSEPTPVPVDNLPHTVEGCEGLLRGSDNVLRNFPEGGQPFNGAVKVVFEYVQDGFECSFVVQQTGTGGNDEEGGKAKFGVDRAMVQGKCTKDDYGDIWMIRKGRHSLEEMVDMAKEDEGKMTKILRVLGWVGLLAGWIMIFSIFTTTLSTLPILGSLGSFAVFVVALIISCVCGCTVMAVAYIRYRPALALGLLVLSLGIWGICVWRMNDAAENGGTTSSGLKLEVCRNLLVILATPLLSCYFG